jgi:hypothetical protein
VTEAIGEGTKRSPWVLTTPDGRSQFEAYRDGTLTPPSIVVRVGGAQRRYHLAAIADLYQLLSAHNGWMTLGGTDEQAVAAEGTVEAWARWEKNPLGGWYGLDAGCRGQFATYVAPVLEEMELARIDRGPSDPRMRAYIRPDNL